MPRPPLIGITAGNHPKQPEHYVLRWDYVRSVDRLGGIPVILAPSPAARHERYLEGIDGLIFSGGNDIAPKRYGKKKGPVLTELSDERDEFEISLMRQALDAKMVILGICRGMQLLNVVDGGTLIQDLPQSGDPGIQHDDPNRGRTTIVHGVELESDSLMTEIFPRSPIAVNSFHHQGIDRLGRNLRATAHSTDGLIEAVEMQHRPFVVGVQWHPESLMHRGGVYTLLFKELIERATQRAHRRFAVT